jgi:hypothetical protein
MQRNVKWFFSIIVLIDAQPILTELTSSSHLLSSHCVSHRIPEHINIWAMGNEVIFLDACFFRLYFCVFVGTKLQPKNI